MIAEWSATLTLCGIYAMIAIATQLGIMCGAFSLAPVGWMCIGAYIAALAATKWQLDPTLAVVGAMLFAAAFGPLIMLPVRRISGLYFALVSLAFVLVVQTIFASLDYTGRSLGIFGVPLRTEFAHVALALAVASAVAAMMTRGRTGRSLRAAGQDPLVARSLGVNVGGLQLVVGSISGVMSVAAGFLYAGYVGYVDPTQFGFPMVVQIVVMVIVGGRSSWAGAILGAFFITSLPLVLRPLAEWRDVVNGALLIVVAVMLPQGLIGLLRAIAPSASDSDRGGDPTGSSSAKAKPADARQSGTAPCS